MTIKDLSEVRASVELLQWADAQKAKIKVIEENARAAVEEAMGESDVGAIDDEVVITWTHSKRTILDQKALKAERPEIHAEYQKTTPTRTFKVVDKE